MAKRKHMAEEIINKLREAEVVIAAGSTVVEADRFGRYGYRRGTALLRLAGWTVNHKRVERIWRREGLKVPARQPRRGRLWLNDKSCVRLRPERENHVGAYDFVHIRTWDGRTVRLLTVIDEYTRECLAIRAGRSIRSPDVIETLAELMTARGVPEQFAPRTTGPSSLPRLSVSGLGRWEQRRYTSSLGRRGRKGTRKASTASEGRVSGQGGLPYAAGGASADQTVPPNFQSHKAAQFPGLQATGA